MGVTATLNGIYVCSAKVLADMSSGSGVPFVTNMYTPLILSQTIAYIFCTASVRCDRFMS